MKAIKYLSVFFYLLLFHVSPAFSYEIKKIGYESGLSNDYITSIAQDKKGYLWFATEWGLNRYDGYTMKVYESHQAMNHTLSGNSINKILVDQEKDLLWIATRDSGLSRYNCHAEEFYNYPTDSYGTRTGGITDLSFADNGDLWIVTYGLGLQRLNRETDEITHLRDEIPGLANMRLWSIADDHKGIVYLGRVDEGLSVFNQHDNTVRTYRHNPNDKTSLPANNVAKVFIDSRGNIWVGTDDGLALFNPQTERFTAFKNDRSNPQSISSSMIQTINEINGQLWVGTTNGGVNILDLDQDLNGDTRQVRFTRIVASKLSSGLSIQFIRDIFQDSFGNIWLGTFGGGINFISHTPSFFRQIRYTAIEGDLHSLSYRIASAICYDEIGQIWIGTEGGGIDLMLNNKRIYHYSIERNNLPDNNLLCALTDTKGQIWFGSSSKGLLLYNQKLNRFEEYPLGENRNLNKQIRCLYEDDRGILWVGTNDGVVKLNLETGKKTFLSGPALALSANLVRNICQDGNGNYWISSLISGVSVINAQNEIVHRFQHMHRISHIYRDSRNRMWLASENGILLFETPGDYTYRIIDKGHGLTNTQVKAIMEGDTDEIWLATSKGISCYFTQRDKVENYDYYEGMLQASYRSGSVIKDPAGTIYFCSEDGVCYFDSHTTSYRFGIPATVITDFSIYESDKISLNSSYPVPVEPVMHLNYNQNTFTIDFSVMDYSLKHRVEYAYTLKQFDDLWYGTDTQNQVTFRNIPPGNYMLKVRARARNQEWTDNIACMQIIIAPPVWLTWWAKTIYMIVIALIAYIFIRFFYEKQNRRKEQELNNEKLRFYTNVAHELRTPLTLILGPLGDLMADEDIKEDHAQKISLIHKSAKRLLDLINQIMEFRKTETENRKLSVRHGDIRLLIDEIVQKYKELNQNSNLSVSVSNETKESEIWFDQEIITIILDNLLSNAIKYTPQGSVVVHVRSHEKKGKPLLEIEIRDTGVGIPDNMLDKIFNRYFQVKGNHRSTGTGIGLALVKNMIQLHEAHIEVKSKVHEGTSFTITLKADNDYPDAEHIVTDDKPAVNLPKPTTLPLLLIVEDEEDIRSYIASSMADSFETIQAADGKEGVMIALERIPDIIISDIMMPIMDGISLTKILKEDIRTSHIPIILLTAKDSVYDKIEGYSTGADSYITKPFNATLLKSRVANLLEARKKITNYFTTNTYKSVLAADALSELDTEFINRTISLIEENLNSKQLNSSYLAEQLCLSYSAMARKIKAITGLTSSELIRKVKMQHAEQLLLSRKYTVNEVAYQLGFTTASHFRQYFKDEFGVLPSKYLKELDRKKE